MTRLLVINPNTSAAVTERLRERALASAPPDGRVEAVTARFGAPYISDEIAAAVAAHATLEAYAVHVQAQGAPDAVVIGCFGDPGLLALRELTDVPVHGLAEAAMAQAAGAGRYAIVTGGARWPAMLQRLALALGLEARLAGIVAVRATGAELAADPAAAHRLLLDACRSAQAQHQPDVLVLGGAALTNFHQGLAAALDVPMLDSVDTAMQVAWRSAGVRSIKGRRDAPGAASTATDRLTAAQPAVPWPGVSPALQALLDGSPSEGRA